MAAGKEHILSRVLRNPGRRSFAEAGIWTAGLCAVAFANPETPAFIEACLFKAVGFAFCPGCGLGHAVGYLARGGFLLSFQSHPFAIFVAVMLLHKISTLIRQGLYNGTHSGDITLNYV